MVESKPWVDGPYALISPSKSGAAVGKKLSPARAVAGEMTCVHNSLLRGINAVHRQCVNVAARGSSQDKLDFANFAFLWSELLHEHHDQEEEHFFPGINELAGVPNLMDANVQEHAVFHDGIDRYAEYLKRVRESKESLDGEKLKAIIESFMPALHTHLVNEIDTLVALEKYGDKTDWQKWFQEQVGRVIRELMGQYEYRVTIFPLAFALHDKDFGGGVWQNFPPLPWILRLILRWLYMNKNKAWWRFAGCDLNSHRKELPFA